MRLFVIIRVDDDITEKLVRAAFEMAMRIHNIKGEVLGVYEEDKIKEMKLCL